MTDHLDQAHEYILRALYPVDTLSGLMDLAAAVSRIFDHLEAQQASPQPATDPPASHQDDSEHRDGGDFMTYTPDQYETDFDRWLDSLTPAQREQITRDIEAAEERIARQEQP